MTIVATPAPAATPPARFPLPLLADSPASPAGPRFRQPPWDEQSPAWRELDRRLPADHRARQIAAAVARLDPADLRGLYAGTGSDPYPPPLLLGAVLFEIHHGRHSPARWARDARECEPLRWLLFGLEPSRSAWYAFRDRLGDVVEALNGQVLQEAVARGWTPRTHGALDGTLVAANASRHKLLNQDKLEQRLAQLDRAVAADERAAPDGAAPDGAAAPGRWLAPTPAGRRRQRRCYQRACGRMEEFQGADRRKRADRRRAAERIAVRVSDPAAALGRDKEKVYRPLYNVQVLDDLDSPLVLAYDVLAQPSDVGTLAPLLSRARQLTGRPLGRVPADAAYASGAELRQADEAGAVVYAPWRENDASAGRRGRKEEKWIPKDSFRWAAAEQAYYCPQGRRRVYEKSSRPRRSAAEPVLRHQYRAEPGQCRACPQAARCTPCPESGRTASRSEHEEWVEALRARMATAEAKELYRLRRQTVELVNAAWKEQRKLRRFSGRGLRRARIQIGLMVLAHNLLTCERLRSRDTQPPEAPRPKTIPA